MRLAMPATVDHWVNDRDGEPLLVFTATASASLAKEMLAIAGEARQLLGDRRATIVFDRGGWSPKLFAALIELQFDILTYRKGRIPKVRKNRFQQRTGTFDGREVIYQLAERELKLKYPGGKLSLRASSVESVGDFLLGGIGQIAKCVVESHFHRFVCSEAERSSGDHFQLIVQPFDGAGRDLSAGSEPV
jgi:hypothetical protein